MKRFDLFTMFNAGKLLAPLATLTAESQLHANAWVMWQARDVLLLMQSQDSPLLSAGRRAASAAVAAIDLALPRDWNALWQIPNPTPLADAAWQIVRAVNDLETVLRTEMPDIAAYVVSQRGIYRTDDLIENAHFCVSPRARHLLAPLAVQDLRGAGRCLAYELSVACAFHLWRAVETVMGQYYSALTGKTFKESKVKENWGAYIRALEEASADGRVTKFLDHIRQGYRNPQTHPDEPVDIEQASRLFGVAVSAIDLMLDHCLSKSRTPALPPTTASGLLGQELLAALSAREQA